ncbi:hypothetical protein LRP49_24385, partial [Enterovibrio sp. ZSDZ35]
LTSPEGSVKSLPLDLHVLGLPPAFNLSHDQTLQLKFWLNEYCFVSSSKRRNELTVPITPKSFRLVTQFH